MGQEKINIFKNNQIVPKEMMNIHRAIELEVRAKILVAKRTSKYVQSNIFSTFKEYDSLKLIMKKEIPVLIISAKTNPIPFQPDIPLEVVAYNPGFDPADPGY